MGSGQGEQNSLGKGKEYVKSMMVGILLSGERTTGCHSLTHSKWNSWVGTLPGNSTSTTLTTWPPPTVMLSATGHWGPPLALALYSEKHKSTLSQVSPTWMFNSGS